MIGFDQIRGDFSKCRKKGYEANCCLCDRAGRYGTRYRSRGGGALSGSSSSRSSLSVTSPYFNLISLFLVRTIFFYCFFRSNFCSHFVCFHGNNLLILQLCTMLGLTKELRSMNQRIFGGLIISCKFKFKY